MRGFIYFITCEPDEYVKIGWSLHNPVGRMNTLQTGCPQPLRLMAYVPGSRDEEKRLQDTFRPLHYRGEWFYLEHKLRDLVQYLSDDWPRPTQRGATRDEFEAGLWDIVVTSGYDYPDLPDVEAYRESADGRLWQFMFPEEAYA